MTIYINILGITSELQVYMRLWGLDNCQIFQNKKKEKKIQKQYISFFQKNNLKTFYVKKTLTLFNGLIFLYVKIQKRKKNNQKNE